MATYQELRTRSQQVRDEQNIGGNTALRVGQLLMDIVKYFNDNDEAASEYLQQHFAMVNDGTHLLNWQQSPIVILHTMGTGYDEGDFSALSQGENYYRAGFIMEANGQGGGINGETPKANVLYVNLANDTLYTWNGAAFDAITSGGGGSISGDDIIKNAYYSNGNLVLVIETEGGDKTVTIPVTFDASNYVPTSRTVNGKALSNNITLSQSDIPGLVAALAALVPQTRTINGKALSSNVTIDMNDIQGLADAIANAGSGAVSVIQPATPDGTFTIRVGETDYTINLNHTHENMAKLVVCEESDLPSTLAKDTIYAQVDDAEDPQEIQSLWIAGLEFVGGGGVPDDEPRITSPKNGVMLTLDRISSGETSVEKTVKIKGRNLVESVSIGISGNGYTLSYGQLTGQSRITIDANAVNSGADIKVVYSDTAEDATGTLTISCTDIDNDIVCNLIANESLPIDLLAVQLTGSQYLFTDYKPNHYTEIEIKVGFSNGSGSTSRNYLRCKRPQSTGELFAFSSMEMNGGGEMFISYPYSSNYKTSQKLTQAQWRTDESVLKISSSGARFTPNGGSEVVITPSGWGWIPTGTEMETELCIGAYVNSSGNVVPLDGYNMKVYELTIKEGISVVRHYTPQARKGHNGLYDDITKTFIYSGGAELVAIPIE